MHTFLKVTNLYFLLQFGRLKKKVTHKDTRQAKTRILFPELKLFLVLSGKIENCHLKIHDKLKYDSFQSKILTKEPGTEGARYPPMRVSIHTVERIAVSTDTCTPRN